MMRGHQHRNVPGAFAGRHSRMYDLVARRLLRGVYRRLAVDVAASTPDGATVLDVGTGPGLLLAELARRRPDLTLVGIDLSADMVAAAARNLTPFGARASVAQADVAELPFADGSMDVVVSSLSLHHWDRPREAIGELGRVLRPGGRLNIYDFPFAPFDLLESAAQERSIFIGGAPERVRLALRIPFLPRFVRFTLTSDSP
jgi:ubiquinone/menaquinone biosynthesis C-methylase UbiE